MDSPHALPAEKYSRMFRQDINGLRAIAVSIVVLYHFHVPYFEGGYLGVDIFFVISGFLMTKIVYRGLSQSDFSVFDFYYARFKRIFPALAAMLIVVGLVLYAFADPVTAASNNDYLVAATLFYSNVVFAFKNSYFASSSEVNWLLHTWSLSVEWQFYMVFPLVAWLIYKVVPSLKVAYYALIIAGLLSFVLAMTMSALSTVFIQHSFFQFPTRSWEMILGGLVALFPGKLPDRLRPVLEILGFGLIVLAASLLTGKSLWPSYMTVLPVLGTALIILANMKERVWHSNAVVNYLGSRSYSLYLWHWPIVVGQAYFGFSAEDNAIYLILGLLLSGLCGELSYRFVERPSASFLSALKPLVKPIAVVVGVAVPVVMGTQFAARERLQTIPTDLTAEQRSLTEDYLAASKDWKGFRACPEADFEKPSWQNLNICRMSGNGHGRIAFIGDSFSEQFLPKLLTVQGWETVDVLYAPGCPPFDGIERSSETYRCHRTTQHIQQRLLEGNYDRVVIISALAKYLDAREDTTCLGKGCVLIGDATAAQFEDFVAQASKFWTDYTDSGVDVRLVGPMFSSEETARELYLDMINKHGAQSPLPDIPTEDVRAALNQSTALIKRIAEAGYMSFVDPLDYLCTEECTHYSDGKFVFKDDDHFRASLVVGPLFDWMDDVLLVPLESPAGVN
ncbi:acyltransferase [Phaeobacter sp. CNT1-3]|nr:acyltransferase [Phaeobacter sp. CNT1-3]